MCQYCCPYTPQLFNPYPLSLGQLDLRAQFDRTPKETPSDNMRLHQDICTELHDLYKKKNADYGDSFHATFLEESFAMARVRLSDKLSRFKSLTRSDDIKVTDESIRDTLIDLANYAIMTVMEIDRSAKETSK